MSISWPDLRSKNRLAEMALHIMAFVIKFFKNSEAFFGKLTFCEFHVLPCKANKMKFFKKNFK